MRPRFEECVFWLTRHGLGSRLARESWPAGWLEVLHLMPLEVEFQDKGYIFLLVQDVYGDSLHQQVLA